MAVRILTYVGLLYQDLIRTKKLPEDGQLPPVFPIVQYNGSKRWHAAQELSSLIQPGPHSLDAYRPQMQYLLIDEGRYRDSELAPLRNLVAALFRLEHSCTSDDIREIVGALREWLKSPEQRGLRYTFSNGLGEVILPRHQGGHTATVKDLSEMQAMLTERLEVWKAEWKQEGQLQGHRNGEAQFLLRLLQKRFGELPRWVSLRVQQAQSEQLECWGERLLDVPNLEALFNGENVTVAGAI